jgi:hypothetical protein
MDNVQKFSNCAHKCTITFSQTHFNPEAIIKVTLRKPLQVIHYKNKFGFH